MISITVKWKTRSELVKAEKKAKTVMKRRYLKEAREMQLALAVATPVDTGRAAASWTLATSKTNLACYPRTYNNPSGRFQDLREYVSGYDPVTGKLYLGNRVPYINLLNSGWSLQQPVPGWIEAVVESMKLRWSQRSRARTRGPGGRFTGAAE